MNEALLKVSSQLQQVSDYPKVVDEPVITTSNFEAVGGVLGLMNTSRSV